MTEEKVEKPKLDDSSIFCLVYDVEGSLKARIFMLNGMSPEFDMTMESVIEHTPPLAVNQIYAYYVEPVPSRDLISCATVTIPHENSQSFLKKLEPFRTQHEKAEFHKAIRILSDTPYGTVISVPIA